MQCCILPGSSPPGVLDKLGDSDELLDPHASPHWYLVWSPLRTCWPSHTYTTVTSIDSDLCLFA